MWCWREIISRVFDLSNRERKTNLLLLLVFLAALILVQAVLFLLQTFVVFVSRFSDVRRFFILHF